MTASPSGGYAQGAVNPGVGGPSGTRVERRGRSPDRRSRRPRLPAPLPKRGIAISYATAPKRHLLWASEYRKMKGASTSEVAPAHLTSSVASHFRGYGRGARAVGGSGRAALASPALMSAIGRQPPRLSSGMRESAVGRVGDGSPRSSSRLATVLSPSFGFTPRGRHSGVEVERVDGAVWILSARSGNPLLAAPIRH